MISRSRSAAPDLGTKHRILNNHEPSWWLRSQLDALVSGWEANGVHACPHVKRSRRSLAAGITALYQPDMLTCPDRCADVFKLDGPPDHQCDRCHALSSAIASVVYDTHLHGMRLLVMFGLCPGCETKELGR
jgi:hypothetical protein